MNKNILHGKRIHLIGLYSNIPEDTLATKKIILIYNGPSWHDYAATMERLPSDYMLTIINTLAGLLPLYSTYPD